MPKSDRKITYAAKKRLYAKRMVRLCRAIAQKDVSAELEGLIENHIIDKLPAPLMRRLVGGDCRRPMREAMKLTVPFFS